MYDHAGKQELPRWYSSDYGDYKTDELPEGRESEKHARARRERKVKNWWHQEKVRQAPHRAEMAKDADFYDHIQYDPDDKAYLESLGQAALTYNEIHPAIQWIVGTERRTRVDWRVLPRKSDHGEEANIKTGVLKFIQDVNKLQFQRSRCFKEAVICGLSWMEYGYDEDPGDFPIFGDWETWRNVWHDSLATDWVTMRDHRYIHRCRIVDLDVAQAMFPKHRETLRRAADAQGQNPYFSDGYNETQLFYTGGTSSWVGSGSVDLGLADSHGRRSRVKLVESWYREPVPVKRLQGQRDVQGVIFDPNNDEHRAMLGEGVASLFDDVYMQMRVMVHIDGGAVLQDMPSPYNHNRFPFVPTYAFIRSRDNAPYGVVRLQRDPQMDLNKRKSKILYLLSVRRTVMDEGAVRDLDVFQEEVARPDSIIEKRRGYELDIFENNQVAQQHLDLALQNSQYVRQVSGVTGENLGLETNADSGRAILARQDQGTTVTQPLFDNHRLSIQLAGEILLSLSEQYLTDEDEFRITGEHNTFDFIQVNKVLEDGTVLNDITAHQADFVVDQQDYRESQRVAMFETLAEMLSQMDSGIAIQLLDLLLELYDGPKREEMVARVRKINGQVDPEQETDEEREAREQAEAQAEDEQRQLQMADVLISFQERLAKIDQSRKASAKDYITALRDAVEAAGLSMQQPFLAQVADMLVQEGMSQAEPPLQYQNLLGQQPKPNNVIELQPRGSA